MSPSPGVQFAAAPLDEIEEDIVIERRPDPDPVPLAEAVDLATFAANSPVRRRLFGPVGDLDELAAAADVEEPTAQVPVEEAERGAPALEEQYEPVEELDSDRAAEPAAADGGRADAPVRFGFLREARAKAAEAMKADAGTEVTNGDGRVELDSAGGSELPPPRWSVENLAVEVDDDASLSPAASHRSSAGRGPPSAGGPGGYPPAFTPLQFSFLREARAKAAESVDAPVDKEAAAADVAPRHEAEAAAGPRSDAEDTAEPRPDFVGAAAALGTAAHVTPVPRRPPRPVDEVGRDLSAWHRFESPRPAATPRSRSRSPMTEKNARRASPLAPTGGKQSSGRQLPRPSPPHAGASPPGEAGGEGRRPGERGARDAPRAYQAAFRRTSAGLSRNGRES